MYWNIGSRTLDLTKRPLIMGILNVTPDSFSDGSCFLDREKAVDRALEIEAEGADILDIGGESTRPGSAPVADDEQLRRVLPVVERLAGKLTIPISIDTCKSSVARKALESGAEIVNDISGMTFDEKMPEVVSALKAGVVLMHTSGKPADMQKHTRYRSVVGDIVSALEGLIASAMSHGVDADRIVVDPGIGFGKDVHGNLEILNKLREFTVLGRPVLVGSSRKSFIGAILDRPVESRIFGTAATVAVALVNGASIIRVHDVKEMRDVADMTMAILRAGSE